MGGMMSITGEACGPPIKPGVAMADLSTGMYATVSVLLALRHAERTGIGQHIDCSLLDTQIAMLANQALSFLVSGNSPGRLGNSHPTVVPYRMFEAKDGPIVVAVGNNGQFAALCRVLGVPDLASDARYLSNTLRLQNRDTLEATLQQLLQQQSVEELMQQLPAAGVPAGPVNTIGQIFADPFVAARGSVHRFERGDGTTIPSVAFPGKLSQTPARFERAPPRLGEHTFQALSEWLGMSQQELDTLQHGGMIVDRNSAPGTVATDPG